MKVSHFLHMSGSFFVPIFFSIKFQKSYLCKVFEVIFLLPSFSRTIIRAFCWAPDLYTLRFFVIQVVSFMVPALGESLNSYQILVYYSDSLCAIIALPYLAGRTPLSIQRYVAGMVFTLIFLYVQSIISY